MKTILCSKCDFWFHQKCCKLSDAEFKYLGSIDSLSFVCNKCCLDEEGRFDIKASLNRLKNASESDDISVLTSAAKFEEIFLKDHLENLITSEKVFNNTNYKFKICFIFHIYLYMT